MYSLGRVPFSRVQGFGVALNVPTHEEAPCSYKGVAVKKDITANYTVYVDVVPVLAIHK